MSEFLDKLKSTIAQYAKPVRVAAQVRDMFEGFTRLAIDTWLGGEIAPYARERLAACTACEARTWLSASEWYSAMKTGLETLPICHAEGQGKEGKNLFCSNCKCFLKAKIRAKKAVCELRKWEL